MSCTGVAYSPVQFFGSTSVLDDLGYVKKTEAETSVLFELIAHRYERKSLLITANQPFSQWDAIFTDSMITVAAVDRLVLLSDNHIGPIDDCIAHPRLSHVETTFSFANRIRSRHWIHQI